MKTATPCWPVSRPPHPIPPWSSLGQAFTPAVPALILHSEELTAELTPPPSARPLLPQAHRFMSLAEPGTGHAPDHLKSHSWSPCPPGASLPESPAPRDGRGGGEDSSFDGAESSTRGCVVAGPGCRRTSAGSPAGLRMPACPAALLCPPHPPSRRWCRGLLHPENASLLEPLALCPNAGDLGKRPSASPKESARLQLLRSAL